MVSCTLLSTMLAVYSISRLIWAQRKNYKKWDIERTLLATTVVSTLGTAFMYFTFLEIWVYSKSVGTMVFTLTEMLITFSYIVCMFRLLITIGSLIGWEVG